MSLFTINSTEENFAGLQVEENGSLRGPNNPRRQPTATDAAMADRDNAAKSLAQSAAEYAAMNEESRAIEIEQNPKARQAQRRIEGRKKREERNAAELQRRQDYKDRNTPGTAPYNAQQARNAEFQARDKAQAATRNAQLRAAVQPMVAMRDAQDAARAAADKRMQDPKARMDSMGSRQGLMGGRLNFAEVKQGDGRSAMYVAPTAAGSQAYVNAKVNPRMGQQAAALGERAMGVAPQMPSAPSPVMPQGMATAPATTQSMVGMPTFDPSKLVVGSPAPARPQPPADPNAAAAIASFNKSTAQQPRGSSPAQNANLQNLQRGNIPTLANVVNVPGKIAGAVGGALQSYGSAVATSPGANFVRDVATGKTPLVAGTKPAAPKPSYQTTTPGGSPITTSVKPEPVVTPRRVVQAANRDKKNSLMVN